MKSIKKFSCRDCGMECSFHTSGSGTQITRNVIRHMHAEHGMDVIPADVMLKVYLAIRDKNPSDSARPERLAGSLTA